MPGKGVNPEILSTKKLRDLYRISECLRQVLVKKPVVNSKLSSFSVTSLRMVQRPRRSLVRSIRTLAVRT